MVGTSERVLHSPGLSWPGWRGGAWQCPQPRAGLSLLTAWPPQDVVSSNAARFPFSARRGSGSCQSLKAWARNGTVLLRPSGQSRCGHRTCSGSRGGDTDPVSMGRYHRICGLLGLHPCLSPSPFSSPDGPPRFYPVFHLLFLHLEPSCPHRHLLAPAGRSDTGHVSPSRAYMSPLASCHTLACCCFHFFVELPRSDNVLFTVFSLITSLYPNTTNPRVHPVGAGTSSLSVTVSRADT